MSITRTFAFALSVTGGLVGMAGAAPLNYTLSTVDPPYMSPILIQGDTTTLPLRTSFFNATGSTVSVLEYVQDDSSCPLAQSSHDWIPLAAPIDAQVPSDSMLHEIDASIPLDAFGPILLGTYETNICIAQDSGTYTTAIPVRLFVVTGTLVAPSGIVTSQRPSLIGAVLPPGSTGNEYFHATFVNNTAGSIGVVAFIQDDPACPESPAAHDWVPMNTYPGSIPGNTQQSLDIAVPFNAINLAAGKFRSYFCMLQQTGAVTFDTTAIPVELKVVADDDVFQEDFE
jgi:hypothetical protein